MANGAATTENEWAMQLNQNALASENAAEAEGATETGEAAAKPAEQRFISDGEAPLLLAFFGAVAGIQGTFDLIPYVGWIINVGITLVAGGIFFIWLTGKVAKGAPKKWYKALWYGALGSFFGGYFGAIMYLLMQDRRILGKVAGKFGEKIEKIAKKTI
jgi:hypothetical protein